MKKSVVLLLSVMLVLSCVTLVSARPQHKPTHTMFSGVVDKVTPADPAKGTKAEIVVLGAANKSMTFTVADACTYYDVKGATITFDTIVKGASVKVTYTTDAQGVHQAISIKLLK
jgi:hypothetical protein